MLRACFPAAARSHLAGPEILCFCLRTSTCRVCPPALSWPRDWKLSAKEKPLRHILQFVQCKCLDVCAMMFEWELLIHVNVSDISYNL